MTDDRAAVLYGHGWRSVDTMPQLVPVQILSVRGIKAEAKAHANGWIRDDKYGPRRRLVMRRNGSLLWAVCWR